MITMKLEKHLELLKEKVQENGFSSAKDLGNEIPFWIFDYLLEKKLFIRKTVDKIIQNLNKNLINVLVLDLDNEVKVNYAKFEGLVGKI